MTESATSIVAQAVLRRADGTSLLDAKGAITAANVAQFAAEPERIGDAVRRLEERGFTIEARDQHTLSISGPPTLFETVFGMNFKSAPGHLSPPQAHVPAGLADVVADVIVPPAPEYFP